LQLLAIDGIISLIAKDMNRKWGQVMNSKSLKSALLLLIAAAIWGFAFVAQRVGIKFVGSFTFNGVRFALGSLSLIPLILINKRSFKDQAGVVTSRKYTIYAGVVAGLVLFCGASLQQIGLQDTTAGKAAFITGLYIVLVPFFSIFLRKMPSKITILAVVFALIGLYLLCVTERLSISKGDMFELIGAFFWAGHILTIDYFTKKVDALKLSFCQFATCSVLSLAVALLTETITLNGLLQASVPILYGGICSVGIAYTLQVVGQKNADPSQAAIILSMETVFAALGGWMLLNEVMDMRGIIGCVFMFIGMLLPQLVGIRQKPAVEA
jgi:drug/metabolite transporter (DMT)-like permease